MKRTGNLWNSIMDAENFRLAFHKAAKGKWQKKIVKEYSEKLNFNTVRIISELEKDEFCHGRFHSFKIYDPKERTINAAYFDERVVHHAIMNVCGEYFDKRLIHDVYACRKGKGQYKALERAMSYSKAHTFYLKLDIKKYFDSIGHEILKKQISDIFKDKKLIALLGRIVDSYSVSADCGIPIGNLASQFFANNYLTPLDRYVKENLQIKAYVRYMDDFLIFGESSDDLKKIKISISDFLKKQLNLELKSSQTINRTVTGITFLGYRVFPGFLKLSSTGKKRYIKKIKCCIKKFDNDQIGEEEFSKQLVTLTSFILKARSGGFRKKITENTRLAVDGLEPRDSGRELEQ